jgi:hypothetical protein
MILKMHTIQFAVIVNLIQMKSMKVIYTRENMMNQEFQHVGSITFETNSRLLRIKSRCHSRKHDEPSADKADERETALRFGRSPVFDRLRNERWNIGRERRAGRSTDGLSGRATTRDLTMKGRKRGTIRCRRPPFPRKRFHFTRFQADRTEVRDLNSLISTEKDMARLHRPMQPSKAVPWHF